jgi:hypothetical protein
MTPGAVRDAGAVGVMPLRRHGLLAGAILLFDLPAEKAALAPAEEAVLRAVAQRMLEVLPPPCVPPARRVRVLPSGACAAA